MTNTLLFKIFAWTIGVLVLLWMLAECLGGVDPADPGDLETGRTTDQYRTDCAHTWEALELASGADVDTLDSVLDRLDALDAQIADGDLKARAVGYGNQAESILTSIQDEGERAEALMEFRQSEGFDLSLQCPVT